jgi:putative heme-binding domain-containing protein
MAVLTLAVIGQEVGKLKRIFLPKSPQAAAYILRLKENAELVMLERSEPVYLAMLERPGMAQAYREEAVAGLARLRGTDPFTEIVGAIRRIDHAAAEAARVAAADAEPSAPTSPTTGAEAPAGAGNSIAFERASPATQLLSDLSHLLTALPVAELAARRAELVGLARELATSLGRQIGLAGVVVADEGVGRLAQQQVAAGTDGEANLLRSIAFVESPSLRAGYYPLVTAHWNSAEAVEREAAIFAASYVPRQSAAVMERFAELLNSNLSVAEVVSAAARIDPAEAPVDTTVSLARALIGLAQRSPPAARTVPPASEAMAHALALAEQLPADLAQEVRTAIASLAVRQIQVHAPYEKMSYVPNVLVVDAGRSTEIVFSNDDSMPHNMLIARPGTYEEVGLAAQAMATAPDAQAKHYVPDHEAVLYATNMIWPQQQARLAFTAPTELGVYPIICTFPGHWMKMYGAMIVVENADAYLNSHPQLPEASALLGRQIVKEWTMADLEQDALALASRPRSFENGKRLFARASCIACHIVRGEGVGKVGPELTKIAEKHKRPVDLLQQILEPSKTIEDQFASVILFVNGRTYRGVVVQRTDTEIWLKENPLVDCEPTIIKLDEIDPEEGEQKSKLSPMPDGLLNMLYPEQIMDLLAFVYSGGNPDDPLFAADTSPPAAPGP